MSLVAKKVVVIGGGTGTSVVLSGLKKNPDLDLYAAVVVSDSGGSTGRLRDEFGFLAVGDLRQVIAALADGKNQEDIRKLLLYRFAKGDGLAGHNLGNLILTALEEIYQSPGKAVEIATQIFKTRGQVFPITEKQVDLVIEYEDGTIRIGEKLLDDDSLGGQKIKRIKFSSSASIYPKAKQAIEDADLIVFGPGDLYASLLPNCLATGFKKALAKNKGKFVYILNLMTHFSQTHNMSAQDHLDQVKKYTGRNPDFIIVNNQPIPKKIEAIYAKQKEFLVKDNLRDDTSSKILRKKLLSKVGVEQSPHDKVKRSFLRHDADKLAKILIEILHSKNTKD